MSWCLDCLLRGLLNLCCRHLLAAAGRRAVVLGQGQHEHQQHHPGHYLAGVARQDHHLQPHHRSVDLPAGLSGVLSNEDPSPCCTSAVNLCRTLGFSLLSRGHSCCAGATATLHFPKSNGQLANRGAVHCAVADEGGAPLVHLTGEYVDRLLAVPDARLDSMQSEREVYRCAARGEPLDWGRVRSREFCVVGLRAGEGLDPLPSVAPGRSLLTFGFRLGMCQKVRTHAQARASLDRRDRG